MTPFESSMSTINAAVWYSLHSFLLLYFLWVLLYRKDRADRLRSELSLIGWELSDGAGSHPDWAGLAEIVLQAERYADHLTVTRLLGAWLMTSAQDSSSSSPELLQARRRIASAVAAHVRLPMLANSSRGFAAVQIAVETASLGG